MCRCSVAAELRVAGTAFVSAPIPGDADWRLRMFTPMREVGYSGHTALYGTHALIEAGRVPEGHVTFTTRTCLVHVEVERHHGPALMWLEPSLPTCRLFAGDAVPILDELGLARADLGGWTRPATTPDGDLLLPGTLRALDPTCGLAELLVRERSGQAHESLGTRSTARPPPLRLLLGRGDSCPSLRSVSELSAPSRPDP